MIFRRYFARYFCRRRCHAYKACHAVRQHVGVVRTLRCRIQCGKGRLARYVTAGKQARHADDFDFFRLIMVRMMFYAP